MTRNEKLALHGLLNAIENVAQSVDAIEAVLIRKGLVTTAEIEAQYPLHAPNVETTTANLRQAIDNL
jgi:hypothetical protein